MAKRKKLKNRAFCISCENFVGHAKNQKSFHKGCENFAHPANATSHTLRTPLHTACANFTAMRIICTPNTMRNAMRKYQRGFANLLCEIIRGVQTHFAHPNLLCEFQEAVRKPRVTWRLFKPLQALFPFRAPYPPFAKTSVTLRRPNSHSLHLPLEQFEEMPRAHKSEDSTTTPLWSIDLSYSLHFLHGADKRSPYRLFTDSQSEAKSLLSEGFDISGPRGPDHSTF